MRIRGRWPDRFQTDPTQFAAGSDRSAVLYSAGLWNDEAMAKHQSTGSHGRPRLQVDVDIDRVVSVDEGMSGGEGCAYRTISKLFHLHYSPTGRIANPSEGAPEVMLHVVTAAADGSTSGPQSSCRISCTMRRTVSRETTKPRSTRSNSTFRGLPQLPSVSDSELTT